MLTQVLTWLRRPVGLTALAARSVELSSLTHSGWNFLVNKPPAKSYIAMDIAYEIQEQHFHEYTVGNIRVVLL